MTQVTLTNLVGKLSPELKQALEASAGAAMNQGVGAIEIEHWILQLISQKDPKLMALCESQKLSLDGLVNELSKKNNYASKRQRRSTDTKPWLN